MDFHGRLLSPEVSPRLACFPCMPGSVNRFEESRPMTTLAQGDLYLYSGESSLLSRILGHRGWQNHLWIVDAFSLIRRGLYTPLGSLPCLGASGVTRKNALWIWFRPHQEPAYLAVEIERFSKLFYSENTDSARLNQNTPVVGSTFGLYDMRGGNARWTCIIRHPKLLFGVNVITFCDGGTRS